MMILTDLKSITQSHEETKAQSDGDKGYRIKNLINLMLSF